MTLLDRKEEHLANFDEAVYAIYLQEVYGINRNTRLPLQKALLKKNLISWLEREDSEALCEVSLRYVVGNTVVDGNVSDGSTININYQYGNNSVNMVEINTGGCITRINLNPAISITNNGVNLEYVQQTPAAVWTIPHGFGYTPNVTTYNVSGEEMEGVVSSISDNVIQITFSQAVAGTAYLS